MQVEQGIKHPEAGPCHKSTQMFTIVIGYPRNYQIRVNNLIRGSNVLKYLSSVCLVIILEGVYLYKSWRSFILCQIRKKIRFQFLSKRFLFRWEGVNFSNMNAPLISLHSKISKDIYFFYIYKLEGKSILLFIYNGPYKGIIPMRPIQVNS